MSHLSSKFFPLGHWLILCFWTQQLYPRTSEGTALVLNWASPSGQVGLNWLYDLRHDIYSFWILASLSFYKGNDASCFRGFLKMAWVGTLYPFLLTEQNCYKLASVEPPQGRRSLCWFSIWSSMFYSFVLGWGLFLICSWTHGGIKAHAFM